jgi:hypothetical protein
MKYINIILLITGINTFVIAQSNVKYKYDYDASGNRIKREIVIELLKNNVVDSLKNIYPNLNNIETFNNESEENNVNLLNIFPNPTFGKVNIITNSSNQNPSDLIIINSTGQILLQEKITTTEYVFDLNNYAVGYYIFKITSAKNTGVWKIVKQN